MARRARRPLPAGLVAAAAVLASLAGLALWFHLLSGPIRLATGLLDASRHLEDAEHRLSKGATDAARFETLAGSAGVDRASDALDSINPMLDVLEAAPKVGPALGEVDHLVAAAEHSANLARGTLDIAQNALEGPLSVIQKSKGGSSIKLDRIVEIGDEIAGLTGEVEAAQEELAAIDMGALPRRARPKVEKAIRKAEEAEAVLADADAAFEILPSILGADGKRTYLIGFQNSAESRGTGGAILQFALMDIDRGAFELQKKTGSIYNVDENRTQLDIPLPPDAWYQMGIPDTRRFGNANWSPDFPLATDLLLGYAAASDPTFADVDGAIAVDPQVIAELIPAVGPIKVEGQKLGKNDIVRFVLNEQYGQFPTPGPRRQMLQKLVDDFYSKIFDPKKPTKLLDGLSKSLSGKHMQIWMSDAREQGFIKRMNWDGALETKENSDYVLSVEQNVGGNKFDYFDTHENEVNIALDDDGATTQTKLTVGNRVLFPQARWVVGDSGGPVGTLHRPMMVLYTRPDTELISATVDGTRVDVPEPAAWPAGAPPAHLEKGRKAWPVTMEVHAGNTVTATFDYRTPGIVRTVGDRKVYRLNVQHQPKVRPEYLTIEVELPEGAEDVRIEGWKRSESGGLVWEGELKRDMKLEVSWRD